MGTLIWNVRKSDVSKGFHSLSMRITLWCPAYVSLLQPIIKSLHGLKLVLLSQLPPKTLCEYGGLNARQRLQLLEHRCL